MSSVELRPFLVFLVAAACMRPHNEVVFADSENRQIGLPPVHVAARRVDSELAALGRAQLLVRVESATGMDRAEVRLTHTRTNTARVALTDSLGRAILDTLPPGEYLGSIRRVGMQQQAFRLRLASGYSDTLRISFGWAP